jgi:hypothetical protein
MSIPTTEPSVLVAGDFWTWEKDIPDYPATTYDLSYVFFNEKTPATRFSVDATADGGTFLIEESDTNTHTAGDYAWQSFLTDTTSKRILYARGRVEIKPDPLTSTADQRTHSRICLESIELVLEGRAGNDVLSYTIGSRQLGKTPIAELLKMRDYYAAKVKSEEAEEKAERGEDDGRLIRGAFYEAQ